MITPPPCRGVTRRAFLRCLGAGSLPLGLWPPSAFGQSSPAAPSTPGLSTRVRTGLEVFLESPPDVVRRKRVGVITNPSGVDSRLRSAVDLLAAFPPIALVSLFAPEHGLHGDEQGMVSSSTDAKTGLPVYSLYGDAGSPLPKALNDIDVLVYDLQDVGARYYTYISTLALAMQAAASRRIPFVVLDRPNPLGGEMVDGPVLDPRWRSFIGIFPIPALHGMTVGELALLFNIEYRIGAELVVIPMDGWQRAMWFDDTELPWVITSPHVPHVDTVVLYPALGPIGDTNLSVGVQTAQPFEVVGGTYIQPWRLRTTLEAGPLRGLLFREAYWRGDPCTAGGSPEYAGIEIRVRDRRTYNPMDLMLHILDAVLKLYPDQFDWGPRVDDRYLFDLEMGTDEVRQGLIAGMPPDQIRQTWAPGVEAFREVRREYLLYA